MPGDGGGCAAGAAAAAVARAAGLGRNSEDNSADATPGCKRPLREQSGPCAHDEQEADLSGLEELEWRNWEAESSSCRSSVDGITSLLANLPSPCRLSLRSRRSRGSLDSGCSLAGDLGRSRNTFSFGTPIAHRGDACPSFMELSHASLTAAFESPPSTPSSATARAKVARSPWFSNEILSPVLKPPPLSFAWACDKAIDPAAISVPEEGSSSRRSLGDARDGSSSSTSSEKLSPGRDGGWRRRALEALSQSPIASGEEGAESFFARDEAFCLSPLATLSGQPSPLSASLSAQLSPTSPRLASTSRGASAVPSPESCVSEICSSPRAALSKALELPCVALDIDSVDAEGQWELNFTPRAQPATGAEGGKPSAVVTKLLGIPDNELPTSPSVSDRTASPETQRGLRESSPEPGVTTPHAVSDVAAASSPPTVNSCWPPLTSPEVPTENSQPSASTWPSWSTPRKALPTSCASVSQSAATAETDQSPWLKRGSAAAEMELRWQLAQARNAAERILITERELKEREARLEAHEKQSELRLEAHEQELCATREAISVKEKRVSQGLQGLEEQLSEHDLKKGFLAEQQAGLQLQRQQLAEAEAKIAKRQRQLAKVAARSTSPQPSPKKPSPTPTPTPRLATPLTPASWCDEASKFDHKSSVSQILTGSRCHAMLSSPAPEASKRRRTIEPTLSSSKASSADPVRPQAPKITSGARPEMAAAVPERRWFKCLSCCIAVCLFFALGPPVERISGFAGKVAGRCAGSFASGFAETSGELLKLRLAVESLRQTEGASVAGVGSAARGVHVNVTVLVPPGVSGAGLAKEISFSKETPPQPADVERDGPAAPREEHGAQPESMPGSPSAGFLSSCWELAQSSVFDFLSKLLSSE